MVHIIRILVMESGSFKTTGGAAKDTYWLCRYLYKNLKGAEIEAYADFSKIGKGVKYVKNIKDISSYGVILLNSIRDAKIIEMHIADHPGRIPFCIYTDRMDVINHYYRSPLKRLVSIWGNLPMFKAPARYEDFANSARERYSSKMVISTRDFFSKSYAFNIFQRMRGWLGCYVAVSPSQAEKAYVFFKGSSTMIECLPRAPHKQFRPLNGAHKDFPGAVSVGRLEESQKNLSFMINGISRAIKKAPELSSSELMRIVGEGPDRKMYESMVDRLGLSANIKFQGFKTDKELVGIYNSAYFFVATSNWESPGRSIIEAMACGTPVLLNEKINSPISTKSGPLLVEDGIRGFVYKSGDIEDFASKFIRMYGNGKLDSSMGKAAYKFVNEQMSVDKLYSDYVRLIKQSMKK